MMGTAALALCLALLVHSAHCQEADQGEDQFITNLMDQKRPLPAGPKTVFLGPYNTCKNDGTLERVTRTITYELFAKNSEETLKHCSGNPW